MPNTPTTSGIKAELKAPGENSVIRLVVMESGTRHVYYKDKLVGSIGDDESLVATLEGLVDETWERSATQFKKTLTEELSKPELVNQVRLAGFVDVTREILRSAPAPRKKRFGLF